VQQTALTLWEKFDAYDPSKPFTPWACRFALNKARQWIERRQRWQALLAEGLAKELANRREELRPELERRLRHLDGCLGKLSEAQRTLVEGYYHRRTGIEALAGESGRTVETTYKVLQRVRHALRLCNGNQWSPKEEEASRECSAAADLAARVAEGAQAVFACRRASARGRFWHQAS